MVPVETLDKMVLPQRLLLALIFSYAATGDVKAKADCLKVCHAAQLGMLLSCERTDRCMRKSAKRAPPQMGWQV